MPLSLIRSTPPATEPVTLAQAKTHCRVDHTADDDLITALIVAAREWIEEYCRRSLITQAWQLSLDDWPWRRGEILLPRGRLISVTSIQYYDSTDTLQTWDSANYYADTAAEPARIRPKGSTTFPTLELDRPNAATITYSAGYGADATDVPQAIRQALLLLVGHWYENREDTIAGTIIARVPMAVEAILSLYRIEWI